MLSKVLIYFMIFQMVLFSIPVSVYAQETTGSTGVNADLTSSQRTMSTTSISSFNPVDIHLGGDIVAVGAGQMLTPAEYIAVVQVLSGGQQNIMLNNAGVVSFLRQNGREFLRDGGITRAA